MTRLAITNDQRDQLTPEETRERINALLELMKTPASIFDAINMDAVRDEMRRLGVDPRDVDRAYRFMTGQD